MQTAREAVNEVRKKRCSRCKRPIEGEFAYEFGEEVVCINCRHGYLNELDVTQGVCTRCGEKGEVILCADAAVCDECRFEFLREAEIFIP